MKKCLYLVALIFLLPACTPVKPWEKQHLANPYMAFDPDRLESRSQQHMYDSREASSGGYGVGGGGCGCN